MTKAIKTRWNKFGKNEKRVILNSMAIVCSMRKDNNMRPTKILRKLIDELLEDRGDE